MVKIKSILLVFVLLVPLVYAGIQPLNCTRPIVGGSTDIWGYNIENCNTVSFLPSGALYNISIFGDLNEPIINLTGSELIFLGNLNVSGRLNVTGNVTISDLISCNTIDTNANGMLTCGSDETGVGGGSVWNSTGSNVYLNNTNYLIGIGTTTPLKTLDIRGNVSISENLTVNNTVFHVDSVNGRVGVGTKNPQMLLHIQGNTVSGSSFLTLPLDVRGDSSNNAGFIRTSNSDVSRFITLGSGRTGDNIARIMFNASRLDIGYTLTDNSAPSSALTINNLTYIGINTVQPTDSLTVVGSVAVYGSLNSTFINATEIRQNTNMVQTVNAIFNLVNYSLEYSNTGWKKSNTSDYLGNQNSSILLTGNLSNIFSSAFTLSNYSAEYGLTGFRYSNLSRVGNNDINSSGSLNITNNVTFTSLKSCDTIDTDSTGLMTCGIDNVFNGTSQTWSDNTLPTATFIINDTTGLFWQNGSTIFSNITMQGNLTIVGNLTVKGNTKTGFALCLTSRGVLGTCSSSVGADGSCTCS